MSVVAVCLGCVPRRWRISAHQIFTNRNRLKVARVNTSSDTTQVVNGQARRDWPLEVLEAPPVSADHTAPVPKTAVAVRHERCSPVPATRESVPNNLRLEPLKGVVCHFGFLSVVAETEFACLSKIVPPSLEPVRLQGFTSPESPVCGVLLRRDWIASVGRPQYSHCASLGQPPLISPVS